MLHAMQPSARGEAACRALLLTKELRTQIYTPGDDEWEKRKGHLFADLDVFITGEPIDPNYMFLLQPVKFGVWEIRSRHPRPGLRVLGLFATKDVFVAINLAVRKTLGGRTSPEWAAAVLGAKAAWQQIFPGNAPLISAEVNDVVSGAIDGQYFQPES